MPPLIHFCYKSLDYGGSRIGIAVQRRILVVLSLLYMLVAVTDLVLLLVFPSLVAVRLSSRQQLICGNGYFPHDSGGRQQRGKRVGVEQRDRGVRMPGGRMGFQYAARRSGPSSVLGESRPHHRDQKARGSCHRISWLDQASCETRRKERPPRGESRDAQARLTSSKYKRGRSR